MRTEFVQTKIRPIRKLFVLDANDFEAFQLVMKSISDEVDQIYNLILMDDGLLWSEVTLDFVRRHDPDIIINLSTLENSVLKQHFEVVSVTPSTDRWKIGRFGTTLWGFSNLPDIAQRLGASVPQHVFTANSLKNAPRSIFDVINFGLVEDTAELHLDRSIFKSVTIEPVPEGTSIIELLFDNTRKFCHLTTSIGFGSGGGTSIYERDYNEQRYFLEGRYIFVGSYLDLNFLCYFWNTRATHSFAELIWIPLEILEIAETVIDDQATLVVPDAIIAEELKKRFKTVKLIVADRYYFSGSMDRWKCFNHTQIVTITGDSVVIQHPVTQSFSDIGMSGACVLEVRGLNECAYPVRASFWELYRPFSHHPELFAERFYRISEKGLSQYCLHISFDHVDLAIEVKLPKFTEVVTHLFDAQGLSVHRTSKTAILEQLVNLVGGLQGAKKLCQQQLFDLIVSLTPTIRTEKALRGILGSNTNSIATEQILEIIGQARDSGAVEFPETVLTVDDLAGKANVKKGSKNTFFDDMQYLYEQRILLRGKSFSCSHCSSKVWFPLESLRRTNYCPECGNETRLPVYQAGQSEKDYYRLNQLLVRAVDQGQLATLLVLNIFSQQSFRILDFVSNLEVKRNSLLTTDIDLFIRIGKKLGIAECKSNSGFSEIQIDSLIEIATCLKCDFVVFSSLLSRTSTELNEAKQYIDNKNLAIPVLIFSKEVLFSIEPIKLYKYFESSMRGEFPRGPIFVC